MYASFLSNTKYALLSLLLLSILMLLPSFAQAQMANECSFSRTLEMGVDGEDVRCLQTFLNEAGFVVAENGPGSPGNETSLFRTLTKENTRIFLRVNDHSPRRAIVRSSFLRKWVFSARNKPKILLGRHKAPDGAEV